MPDFTTEDAKENHKAAGDDVVSCNKDIAEDNLDNALSPHSEAPDVKKEMAPLLEMQDPDPRRKEYTLVPNCVIEEEEEGEVEGEGGGGEEEEEEDVELGINSQKVGGADEDDSSHQDQVILKKELETKKVLMPLESFSGITLKRKDGKGLNKVQGAKSCSDTENKEREVQDTRLCSDIENDEERVLSIENHGFEMVTENETKKESGNTSAELEVGRTNEMVGEFVNTEKNVQCVADMKPTANTFVLDKNDVLVDEPETEEDQAAFMKELEAFHKVRCLEFKPPKFYGEPLNCLKLWRAVIRLGGYEQVTACKLWRQVGESFNPPKTCTTVSWTFRGFYEKALLEYEKHKMRNGELPFNDASFAESSSISNQAGLSQASGSGRARRDAAARAMQGWHTQRLLGNGEVGDPIIKDKNSVSTPKREKQLKSVGLLKRKKISPVDHSLEVVRQKTSKLQLDIMVVDIGPPADWVKINVQRTKDCFEVYALVPGLLREEVRVQSDPAGRLVITGQPEQLDNPWGVMPFKKVVSLPSRIDPHQTSAVVTLHGQLFVRVPFEQSDM